MALLAAVRCPPARSLKNRCRGSERPGPHRPEFFGTSAVIGPATTSPVAVRPETAVVANIATRGRVAMFRDGRQAGQETDAPVVADPPLAGAGAGPPPRPAPNGPKPKPFRLLWILVRSVMLVAICLLPDCVASTSS
jgi:hypothetical protein